MALVVNTDTYISQTDASAYLTSRYLSTDAKLIAWNALSSDNKDVLLRRAADLIDSQPLQGVKVESTQTMQFPRMRYTNYYQMYDNSYYWPDITTVPDPVKHAQVEIAFDLVSGISQRNEMQQQGVKSFSVSKLSETYTGSANALFSTQARKLLKPYLAGSVGIV
jgi:hypothetical protein